MSVQVQKPKKSLYDRAKAYISKLDAAIAGSGGDKQTFIVACKLVEFGLNSGDAMTLLSEYNQRCQPPWSEAALSRKLRCAYARTTPNPDFTDGQIKDAPKFQGSVTKERKWPKLCESSRARIVLECGVGLSDLCDLSPVGLEAGRCHTVHILNTVFPGNPLVCCGKSSDLFWTKPLSDFGRHVEGYQLVVPSPMSKLVGKIQDPEPDGPTESAHTKDNTGERRFAVVEFDSGSHDEHASLLWHLSNYAPLVMAVHSGGKSLHGWFYVQGSSEDKVLRFYRYAVSIGADRATYLKSQFVRMPDGLRNNGNRQAVYYFDPFKIPGL